MQVTEFPPKSSSSSLVARTAGALAVIVTISCVSSLTLASRRAETQSELPDPAAKAEVFLKKNKSLSLLGSSNSIADAAEAALPAVVNISTSRLQHVGGHSLGPFGQDPLLRRFFGAPGDSQGPRTHRHQSLGSGVVISSEGIVLTNNHVIEGADEIQVTLSDGSEFRADIIGTDAPTDLAVIRLVGVGDRSLSALSLGDDDDLRLGEIVLAVGTPFGLSGSVTMGIVSAKGRGNVGIVDYEDFIQTDAAINPGNSGGALLNLEGELVGINTAIASRSGGNQGVGFAIPSTLAAEIMARLMEDGVVERSWLGVSIQPFTPAIARAFNSEGVAGVLVSGVQKGSPASNAGVQAGDVVLSFGAQRVESPSQLRHVVALSAAGVAAKLEIMRDGRRKLMNVILERNRSIISEIKKNNDIRLSSLEGLRLEDLRFVDGRERRQLGVEADVLDGVLIRAVDPGSAASRAGLRAGDVIVEVNRHEISTMKELQKQVSASSEALITRVIRGEASLYVLLS